MTSLPVLPPKYYLSHFFELIGFLEENYLACMGPEHRQFILDFHALTEDAQCVFVRMLNRKGTIFSRATFQKYGEIPAPELAFAELIKHGFTAPVGPQDENSLARFLPKTALRKWLLAHGLPAGPALSRADLLNLAISQDLDVTKFVDLPLLVTQQRTLEVEYLLFLYFGKICESLTLYTLRDLGIRQSGTLKVNFRPRFQNYEEAQSEFFFAHLLAGAEAHPNLTSHLSPVMAAPVLSSRAQTLKDHLLDKIGVAAAERDPDLALQAWLHCTHSDTREKAARLLHKSNRLQECRQLLEEIVSDPRSDVELLFAEDFLARKYEKKKVGYLTQMLRDANELTLSDYYVKQPEIGVCEHFRKMGYSAKFSENGLWMSLFAVVFWGELFTGENAAIYNQFERYPTDLDGNDFYRKNQVAIEAKLKMFVEGTAVDDLILPSIAENYGRLNGLCTWSADISDTLTQFARNAKGCAIAHVLRQIARQFASYHSGFPDIVVEKNGELKFIEVKAEGDSLRPNQFARIRLLQEAGFAVEVLRVRWQVDPSQVYVAVDIETTGNLSDAHRITEIAAVKVQNGVVIDEFQSLVNPERSIPAFITRITGIDDKMVAHAPKFASIAEEFSKFTAGAVFVAHNVGFDYGFIRQEYTRLGLEFTRPKLCTCTGMRKAYPGLPAYGLKALTQHFSISLDQHHRALCDARAAAQLLNLMNMKRQAMVAGGE